MEKAALFPGFSRLLHWTMAILILAMLFIGVGMVASNGRHESLIAIHRPLGIAILVLAAIRLINRLLNPPPPLPQHMPGLLKFAAQASHYALYGLMFAVPLVGWSMLSAGGYPVLLWGSLHLPPILPHDAAVYAALRHTHTILALSLFLVFLAHLGAALMHAFLFRDGVFESMASLQARTSTAPAANQRRDD